MKNYNIKYSSVYQYVIIDNLKDNPTKTELIPVFNSLKEMLLKGYKLLLQYNKKGAKAFINLLQQDKFSFLCNPSEFSEAEEIGDINIEPEELYFTIVSLQILLLDLLINGYINIDDEFWHFNVLLPNEDEREIFENITYREEIYGTVQEIGISSLEMAITDLIIGINKVANAEFTPPVIHVSSTSKIADFIPAENSINLYFSLFEQFVDADVLDSNTIILQNNLRNNSQS